MSVIDIKSVNELMELGIFKDVKDIYTKQWASRFQALIEAKVNKDIKALKSISHELKGASRSIGALALAQSFAQIESSCVDEVKAFTFEPKKIQRLWLEYLKAVEQKAA